MKAVILNSTIKAACNSAQQAMRAEGGLPQAVAIVEAALDADCTRGGTRYAEIYAVQISTYAAFTAFVSLLVMAAAVVCCWCRIASSKRKRQ